MTRHVDVTNLMKIHSRIWALEHCTYDTQLTAEDISQKITDSGDLKTVFRFNLTSTILRTCFKVK